MVEQMPWDLNDPRTTVALVVVGVLAFLFLTGLLFQRLLRMISDVEEKGMLFRQSVSFEQLPYLGRGGPR